MPAGEGAHYECVHGICMPCHGILYITLLVHFIFLLGCVSRIACGGKSIPGLFSCTKTYFGIVNVSENLTRTIEFSGVLRKTVCSNSRQHHAVVMYVDGLVLIKRWRYFFVFHHIEL